MGRDGTTAVAVGKVKGRRGAAGAVEAALSVDRPPESDELRTRRAELADAEEVFAFWLKTTDQPQFTTYMAKLKDRVEALKERMVSVDKAELVDTQAEVRALRKLLVWFAPDYGLMCRSGSKDYVFSGDEPEDLGRDLREKRSLVYGLEREAPLFAGIAAACGEDVP